MIREHQRLDAALVARGLFETRSRARDAILRGTVRVNGVLATKPGQPAGIGAKIVVDDPAAAYVSRAALKLVAGLDAFAFSPFGKICLDIGASTGGFTQVLLERGSAHVTAIDVGHGQMAAALRDDPRVTAIEGLNARDLSAADLGGTAPQIIVCDVSFISVRLALPPALALAAPGAQAVFLVKPQFEVGRAGIGKNGLVDPALAAECAQGLLHWLDTQPGWRALGLAPSPIMGGDGNAEYLLGGEKTA